VRRFPQILYIFQGLKIGVRSGCLRETLLCGQSSNLLNSISQRTMFDMTVSEKVDLSAPGVVGGGGGGGVVRLFRPPPPGYAPE